MENSNDHHQVTMAALPLEEVLSGCKHILQQQQQQEKKLRPHQDQPPLKCPRCESSNTKFCYYNNYSLSQPRYFCKGCRRYWTKGGSLRNVPVGGGCRKNKKPPSSNSCTTSTLPSNKLEHQTVITNNINTTMSPQPAALTSLFSLPPLSYHDPNEFNVGQLMNHELSLVNPNPITAGLGFIDIFKTSGIMDVRTGSSIYSGYNGDEMPFDGCLSGGGATATTATTVTTSSAIGYGKAGGGSDDGEDNKVLMGLQWPLRGDGSIVVESGTRDLYRNVNGFGASWHGLIDSSLI